MTRTPERGLVGKWFHAFDDDGAVTLQGQILSKHPGNLYLVQLYDWWFGAASTQKLVPLSDMVGWLFYDDEEDMRFAWEYRGLKDTTDRILDARRETKETA